MKKTGISIAVALSLLLALSAAAEEEKYFYEGRQVSKDYLQALELARQAGEFIEKGEYKEAEPLLRKSLEQTFDDASLCENFAHLLVKLGKPREALSYFEKAAKLNSDSENCWIGWAGAYGKLGELENAAKKSREFLSKFPKSSQFEQMKNQAELMEAEWKQQEMARKAAAEEPKQAGSAGANYLLEANGKTSCIWKQECMPISVCVEGASTIKNWHAEFSEFFKEAFAEWESAAKGALKITFVDKPENASVVCSFTDDLNAIENPAELGQTKVSCSAENFLTAAKIEMLTVSPLEPGKELSKASLKQTALHEAGHALGIRGHSSDPGDIMYFARINTADPKLSLRDAGTICKLYEADSNVPARH